MKRLLALSGSLRAVSSNTSILRAAQRLAPSNVFIEHYDDLGNLPHFNPDLEASPPGEVIKLRERVGQASGLLISCPEYARGIPGTFKNALDWLVGSEAFPGKPVALINTSPRASAAQAALRLVLTTMSAQIVEEACVTVDLLSRQLTAEAIAANPTIAPVLSESLRVFCLTIDPNTQPARD